MTYDASPFQSSDAFQVMQARGGADPHPFLAQARQRGGVHRFTRADLESFPGAQDLDFETQLMGRDYMYAVFSRDHAAQVLRTPQVYCSRQPGLLEVMGPLLGRALSLTDDDEHTRMRKLVFRALRPRALDKRWEEGLIRPLVHGMIDEVVGSGRADLTRQLALPLPIQVISAILGLPPDQHDWFRQIAFEMIAFSVDRERALRAGAELRQRLLEVVSARRVAPGDDLISDLATARDGHDRLSDPEVLDCIVQVLLAGAQTTYHGTGTLLFALLTHPEQLAAVRSDRSLVEPAIEEVLRWEPPLLYTVRAARLPATLDGHDILPGDFVVVVLASANRDEAYYDDPDRFDVFRPQIPHLAFATGPHVCIGIHLARLEMRIALTGVLDRLVNLRLDPASEQPCVSGGMLRGPNALPVLFD